MDPNNIKEYGWDEGTLLGNYLYYEKCTGRIVGEVARVGMTGSRSQATSFIDPNIPVYLGNYIDYAWAKMAVERRQAFYDGIVDGNLLDE